MNKKHTMKVSIHLMGGLGNQLFQLAFLDYISKNTGYIPCIEDTNYMCEHSSIPYFNSIFQNWKHLDGPMHFFTLNIVEYDLKEDDWITKIRQRSNVRFTGYFQNYKYITQEFISKLTFDLTTLNKYPDISQKVFIHLRGGDYLRFPTSDYHNVGLSNYYERAISLFPSDTQFVIFTNDKDYTNSCEWLKNLNYTIIEENEIDSLFLMSKCSGGICANSSFSWWGAYLNPNRKLILPSKWFNDIAPYATSGYYFNECTIVEV
jgi:hypothetical protein